LIHADHCAGSLSRKRAPFSPAGIPAAWTKMSIVPSARSAASTMLRTESAFVTSPTAATALPPAIRISSATCLGRVRVEVVHRDLGTRRSQRLRDAATDCPTSAGHQQRVPRAPSLRILLARDGELVRDVAIAAVVSVLNMVKPR
jgi:hypothetical protein